MSSTLEASASRPFRSVLGLVVAALLLLLAVAAITSYQDFAEARRREAYLEDRIEQTRRANQELEHWIDRLDSDPTALERLAREEYGMVRPAETIIVLPRDEEPPGPPPGD